MINENGEDRERETPFGEELDGSGEIDEGIEQEEEDEEEEVEEDQNPAYGEII